MTRIFISHSHSDEAISYKLFDFLICVFPDLRDEDILCTADPNSGLSFDSNSISDQLKTNLKGAEALFALITTDSLRSLWIPFEIGSFWTTEKPIVLILGPDLAPDKLPGPLKGWLCIRIEDDQAFDKLNAVTNQLEQKLNIRQNVHRRRRDRHLDTFITQFRAWQSNFPPDTSQQQEIEQLTKKLTASADLIQKLTEKERSHNQQLVEIETASQQEKADIETNYQNQINDLKQQLAEAQSQLDKQLADSESAYKQQLETLTAVQPKKVQAQNFIEDLGNGINLEMIAISGGKFLMGSPTGEGRNNEKPQHEVSISPFFLGKYPITQAQYQQVMGQNPSHFKGDDLPVEQVSWDKAAEFCQRLSNQTGTEYRLPSEAEWEYACRAGTSTKYYFGNDQDQLKEHTWYKENSNETHSIGEKKPNQWGLYDLYGNVWELCQDNWHGNYENAPSDSSARTSNKSSLRVMRGASWSNNPSNCRSAYRNSCNRDLYVDDIGFRVVRVAPRTK